FLSRSTSLFHRVPPPRAPHFPYTTLFRSTFDDDDVGSPDRRLRGRPNPASRQEDVARGDRFGVDEEAGKRRVRGIGRRRGQHERSEEHTSELQSPDQLVCRLLLEKKKPEK